MLARHVGATIAAALLIAGSIPLDAQSPDGRWRSEGYGLFFEVSDATMKAYELTAISCLPSFTAERVSSGTAGDITFKVVGQAGTYVLRPGGSPDRRLVHRNGAASDIVIRRVSAAPMPCSQPLADTPLNNFDVFARTWADQYGFFDLRKADWRAMTTRARARVMEHTTPRELFQILRGMIEPFEDAHTRIVAEPIGETFRGGRRTANWLEPAERERAFAITEQKYVRGALQTVCNGQVQYGRLDSDVGYLRLKSFSNFGSDPGFESGSRALETALDRIFADSSSWPGLVIDVRINSGGSDAWGLEIASRLATTPYIAYAKQARSDPNDASRWTAPQPSGRRGKSRCWSPCRFP